jgi:hypothetical protein
MKKLWEGGGFTTPLDFSSSFYFFILKNKKYYPKFLEKKFR